MKIVTREEWKEFMEQVQKKFELEVHVVTICEPPLEIYYEKDYYKDDTKWVSKINREWMRDGEIDKEGHKRFYEYSINEKYCNKIK